MSESLDRVGKILAERGESYDGDEIFHRIAAMWQAYIGVPLSAAQVAHMMVLFKICRADVGSVLSEARRDDVLDIIGYAALAADLAVDKP